MKIFVIGTRGIPNIVGGIETHSESLYPLLVNMGYEITIARRAPYVIEKQLNNKYKGIELVDLYSPKIKSLETIVHTLLGLLYAKASHFKFIHIHAIGPSLVIPLARLLGFKVVMTHHGPDYDRQKWGRIAKIMLKLGEWSAAKYAQEIIVISNTINTILKEKYNRQNANLIPNGVNLPQKTFSVDYINSLGLEKQNYIIAVGRFVPEKGFHDLIEAYLQLKITHRLVLVGDTDHESKYSKEIKAKARQNGIVLTGFIKGNKLNEILTHAALFVMPSYHEGLPIALLEAMSYNLRLVVSDIPANLEIGIEPESYFKLGNIMDLANKIKIQLTNISERKYHDLIIKNYNWFSIANKTADVYLKLNK